MTARQTESSHRECVVYWTRSEDFADPWVESSRPVRSVRIHACLTNGFVGAEKSTDGLAFWKSQTGVANAKTHAEFDFRGNCANRLTQRYASGQMAICGVPCIRCCANAKKRGAMNASRAAEGSQVA
jgi:hypothetical protein